MYKKILLAIDGSPTSDKVLTEVANVAAPGAVIRVMHVVEDPVTRLPSLYGEYYDVELVREALLAEGHKLLAQAGSRLSAKGFDVETRLVDLRELGGGIPEAIKAESDAWGANLTILGTHGRRGMRRLLLGSVAEQFMRISDGPVLLVRSGEQPAVPARRRTAAAKPASVPPLATDHA
ncbi:universal stress protein [Collimonas sp.]|uniref:universal stress protein n=1 Tax=Collimonas sp. TaxID=1963772 RepID=UPI002D06BBAB|nr:universal stress protein [Collimonas sp.]HWX02419.1 universal stress protein [Collimonas sp.]